MCVHIVYWCLDVHHTFVFVIQSQLHEEHVCFYLFIWKAYPSSI